MRTEQLCLLGLLTLTSWTPAVSGQGRTEAERWIGVETTNFDVMGNLAHAEMSVHAVDLEALHAALEQLNPGRRVSAPTPPRVLLLSSAEWFARYAPARMSASGTSRSSGYFHASSYMDHVVIRADPATFPRRTLRHEYLHAFLHHNLPEAPLWLNEGLAELYSTLEIRDGQAVLGQPRSRHLRLLGTGRKLPLRTLLETDTNTRLYHRGERRSLFYAQSWALVHYLLLGLDDGGDGLRNMLSELGDGEAPLRAFTSSFGTHVQQLEDDLTDYLAGELPTAVFDVDLSRLRVSDPYLVTPTDAAVRLAELWVALGGREEARHHLDLALSIEPENSRALATLGRLAESAGDTGNAEAWYRQATSVNPQDPWPKFLLGNLIVRDAVARQPLQGEDLELVGFARDRLRESTAAQPSFGPAWGSLGLSWLVGGEAPPREALAALRRARDLMPRRPDVVYHQAMTHIKRNEWQQAYAVIDGPLKRLGEVDLTTQAERSLAHARVEQAAGMVDQNQPTAESLLDDLESDPDPALSEFAPRLAEIRRVFEHNDSVRLYNQAVDAARRGSREEAQDLLQRALSGTTDRELRRSARQLLEALDQ